MGKNSNIKKDRRIIREKLDGLFKDVENSKNEQEFFEKLETVQNFDYLIQKDPDTKNKFMHKDTFNKIQSIVIERIIDPGVEENKLLFNKIYNEKKIPDDMSLKELALFAVFLKDKVSEIREQENYKEILNKLNDEETIKQLLLIKKMKEEQNKEIGELEEKDQKVILDYLADINKVIDLINNEIIEIGDKVVKKSEEFNKEEKDLNFGEVIYSSYIVAYNNNCFIPAVKEVEEYNKVINLLNGESNNGARENSEN